MVGHAGPVDALQKFANPYLAFGDTARSGRVDAIICLFHSDGPDHGRDAAIVNATAAVALDDVEAAEPEKAIGLRASGESVRAQALARSDLMGQRDRVLRRQMPAVCHQAVASAPSSRWNSITDDAPYGFRNVCLGDACQDHDSLSSPLAAILSTDNGFRDQVYKG